MKEFLIVIFAIVPAVILTPAGAHARNFSKTDYARHIRMLRARLPLGFTIVLEKPFVVVGDESPAMVQRRARGTVRWAATHLKQAYFVRNPRHIITVWLFKDQSSYQKHAWLFFRTRPDTPYGYYSPRYRALVMNIATGGGTLVHEMVHPFMEANFPDCPPWFNEGLASLYEQSGSRDGRIVGYTNWRLAGLQRALRGGAIPAFKKLMAMNEREFYEQDRGDNYAQARYLCYYLQERGLLREYYRRFVRNAARDPGGYRTLQAVLGEKDMNVFQKRWSVYVLKLRYE